MALLPRQLTNAQKSQIRKNASEVRRRRIALGLRQRDLDVLSDVKPRTVERVERRRIDHRVMPPDQPIISRILRTLSHIEQHPKDPRLALVKDPSSRSIVGRVRRAVREVTEREAITLEAVVKYCPDQGVWITQGGCDGMRQSHRVCRSMNGGRGCRGVKHRRGLEAKLIKVDYKPPSPDDVSVSETLRRTGGG